MRPRLILLCMLTLMLSMAFPRVISVQAQCQDAAGGSVDCPNDSNPNEDDEDSTGNISAPERIPGDFDGDGSPDETDQCVEQSGPDWNNGCPTDLTAPPVTDSPDPTAPAAPQDITMPLEGPCVITPNDIEKVNVREEASPVAAVVDTIAPGQSYEVLETIENDSGVWHHLLLPSGWVSGIAVKVGGDCSVVFDPDGLMSTNSFVSEPEEEPTAAKQKKSCADLPGGGQICVYTKGKKLKAVCEYIPGQPDHCTFYR